MKSSAERITRFSTPARIGLLALLLGAEVVIVLLARNEEGAMDGIVFCLFLAAPLLAWFTIEPELDPGVVPRSGSTLQRLIRFPCLPGGASGVVLFLLVFALVVGVYVLWLRALSRRGVWLADDDPVQLVMGALYACVYVLLPVGLCSPILRWWWGRVVAAMACIASYFILGFVFPAGPREPRTLTELGHPGLMISTVLGDGHVIHYARDDLAVLAGLAALGVLLNVPRVVTRWRLS